MSPLDPQTFDDPRILGLLQLGAGMMKAGGPSRMPTNFLGNFGTAGEGAIAQMQHARELQIRAAERAAHQKLYDAQMKHLGFEDQKIQQELDAPAQLQSAWQEAISGQQPAPVPFQGQLPNPLDLAQGKPLVPNAPMQPPEVLPQTEVTAKRLPSTMNPENWFKVADQLMDKGKTKIAEAAVQRGLAVMGLDKNSVHPDGNGGFKVFDREGNLIRSIPGEGGGQQDKTSDALYKRYLGPPYNMKPDAARKAADASAFNLIRFVPDAQGGVRTMYEPEAMGNPGGITGGRPSPYNPSGLAGGQIGGSQGSKGTEKLYEDVQQFSTAIDKKGLAGVDIGMRSVAAKLKEFQSRPDELPGIGYLKNLGSQGSVGSLANFALTEEGKDLKSAVQGVMNTLMHSEVGAAQTVQESMRQMTAILEDPTSSARDFFNGWANLTKKINANKANIINGFAPEVHQEYSRRAKTAKDHGYDAMDLSAIPIIEAQKPLPASKGGNIPISKPLTESGKQGWKIEEIK